MLNKFDFAFKQRSNVAINCGYFLGLRLRIMVVKYVEHFTITFILDNDGSEFTAFISNDPHLSSIREFAVKITKLLTAHSAEIRQPSQARIIPLSATYKIPDPPEDFETNDIYLNDILYREVWVAFDDALGNNEAIKLIGRAALRSDSRGLLLTAAPSEGEFVDLSIFSDIQRSAPTIIKSPIPQPKTPSIRDYLQSEVKFISATLAIGSSDNFLVKNQLDMQWDQNNVLCFVNKETAIYGSRLEYRAGTGDLEFDTYHKNYDYTRYFIIYDGTNDFALGRLMRRIHVLGELRILALIERSEITMLSDSLKILGNALSKIIDHMTGRLDEYNKKQAETLDVGILSAIVDGYNDIGKRRELLDVRHEMRISGERTVTYKRCYGGLSYRLNRSKYYYEALNERINDLNCSDIVGFQSYSRYVVRNYNQQMRSITSIGDRYAALGSRIDRAVSIAHGLQQRKFAQYAANIAICIAGVPAFNALNSFFVVAFDGKYKSIETIVTMCMAVLIIFGVIVAINIVRELLLEVGLYVIIKNSISGDPGTFRWRSKIVEKIADVYDATRLLK